MPRYVAIIMVSEDAGRILDISYTNKRSDLESIKELHGKFIHEDPVKARNRHKILVSIYQMPVGWRLPDRHKLEKELRRLKNQGLYWYNLNVLLAERVRKEGEKIFPDQE